MQKNNILLSLGIFPWMDVKTAIKTANQLGYDGLEILPTRKAVKEKLNNLNFKKIKSIHQSWRLDIGQDNQYGINKFMSLFFMVLRLAFFPDIYTSKKFIESVSRERGIPLTIHDISSKWTQDTSSKEFAGGLQYEILDNYYSSSQLKEWLKNKNHFIEADTRDDQSIIWAKKNGFKGWKEFWKWIGIEKIKGIQLSLIGTNGIKKIINRKKSLAEEQFLWLNEQKWKGDVTVEINPVSLFLSNNFDVKGGLKTIFKFVDKTLRAGKKWSN